MKYIHSSNRKLLFASKVNKKVIIIENWVFIYLMTLMPVGSSKKYTDSRLEMVRLFFLTSTTVAADTFLGQPNFYREIGIGVSRLPGWCFRIKMTVAI